MEGSVITFYLMESDQLMKARLVQNANGAALAGWIYGSSPTRVNLPPLVCRACLSAATLLLPQSMPACWVEPLASQFLPWLLLL